MTSFRSRLLVLCIAACAGCQHSAVIDTEARPTKAATPTMPSPAVFDIKLHGGQEVTVEGVLEGRWIYSASRTGLVYGGKGKGGQNALTIRYQNIPLALLGETDDVAKLLADQAGQLVRLQGRIVTIHQEGHPGVPGGQQGYTGPTPGYTVYCLEVTACKLIDPGEIK